MREDFESIFLAITAVIGGSAISFAIKTLLSTRKKYYDDFLKKHNHFSQEKDNNK